MGLVVKVMYYCNNSACRLNEESFCIFPYLLSTQFHDCARLLLVLFRLGAVCKGRPANGEGVVLKFRTGGGGFVKFGRPQITEKIEITNFLRAHF